MKSIIIIIFHNDLSGKIQNYMYTIFRKFDTPVPYHI